jgi:hypothetical protein
MPIIPTIEASSEGAGIGSFNKENAAPATKPVRSALQSNIGSKCMVVLAYTIAKDEIHR